MKRILILIGILCTLKANSQDYYLTFSGAGESSSVATVSVENLTSGMSLVMNGSDILHLTNIVTGNHSTENNLFPGLRIYPNPVTDNSTVEICPPEAGNACISILDITGKPVATIQSYLEKTKQSFRLSGINKGFYLINVKGNNYQFSGKLLSGGSSAGTAGIENQNSIIQTVEEKPQKAVKKGALTTVDMAYTPGDRLKFIGESGIYRTVKTDIPASDKTISFNFYQCTDGDNNNYPVVEIGRQVWMAENLKTTRYNDGSSIPLIMDAAARDLQYSPAYWWENNDESRFYDSWGALYNCYALFSWTNGNKNICPVGWHLSGIAEWNSSGLGTLSPNSLKETGTIHWPAPNAGATNATGFTAVPSNYWSSVVLMHDSHDYPFRAYCYGLDGSYGETSMKNGNNVRCLMNYKLPIIKTSSVSSITFNSATSGGIITSDGSYAVSERGICWSTTDNPTIYDNHLKDLTGTGSFTCSITGLTPGTTYYLKAYATNSSGTAYGDQVIFCTKVTDVDGNTYNTVAIGTQVWMTENLKTTKFNDGTDIPLVTDNTAWINLSTPGFCWFNNDETSYKSTYGALYNWFTVNTGKLCPAGWHVPTDSDWTTLSAFLGGDNITGGKLKEAGTIHWKSPNTGATNESGFTALPSGNRTDNAIFYDVGNFVYWWSSTASEGTSSWLRYLSYNYSTFNKVSYEKRSGFSVRCLKDDYPDLTTESITSITSTSANSGGNITSEGSGSVIARGVCWSSSHNPTIADNKTINDSGRGQYTSSITGLSANTTYFVRAYATNSVGTSYGNELILKTYTGTATDIDGNVYNTVTIGTQVWMVENLRTTKFNDNTTIPLVTDNTSWSTLSTPGYCWYNNDEASYKATYGALYNRYTVDVASNGDKNVCPTGWHVPNDVEWTTLKDNMGANAGGKLKEAGIIHWQDPNYGATNESGFTALPGGCRISSLAFDQATKYGYWWSSTTKTFGLNYDDGVVNDRNWATGYSIRCIQDNP
jgi:uncharacterized protein (TIGR02145 family)